MGEFITSPRTQARIAGFLYIVCVLTSVYALIVTSGMIVSGDAAATAANIRAGELMFRLGFAANLVACCAYIAVVAMLYEVMKPAGRTLSIVAAFFGLAGCAVSGASMINHIATLSYLGDASYLSAFDTDELNALARLSLSMSTLGNSVGLVFFGCYCSLLSLLVFRARFLPSILGVLLAIAGIGWLVGNFSAFLAPELGWSRYLIPVSELGETLFTLWLMIMGVNPDKWRAQAEAAA